MLVIYKPEGAVPREFKFEPTRLMSPEVETIERNTGMNFGSWVSAVTDGSFIALHGLLFVMLKRGNPTLKWDDVQFCLADIDFAFEKEEAREIQKTLMKKAEDGPLDDSEIGVLEQLKESGLLDDEGDDPKESSEEDLTTENLLTMN